MEERVNIEMMIINIHKNKEKQENNNKKKNNIRSPELLININQSAQVNFNSKLDNYR